MAEINEQVEKTIEKQKARSGEDISLRYRGLSFEMAAELQACEDEYFTWDLPVPFGEKLQIYPASVRQYNTFMEALSCFLLDKKQLPPNATPADIKKQFKMTDLEYLLSKLDEKEWVARFVTLMEIIFHIKNGMKCPHCGETISYEEYQNLFQSQMKTIIEEIQQNPDALSKYQEPIADGEEDKNGDGLKFKAPTIKCPKCGGDGLYETIKYEENKESSRTELFIDGQKIDQKNFNRLRNIVLFQNLPDYRDTSYIDPNLKKDYETKKKIQSKQQGSLTATLEKKLAAMKVFMGLPNYDNLYKMTIRKFLIEFTTMDDLISYELQMMGRLCGLGGGSDQPVQHWIYQEIKDVYADGGYVSKDTMMEKVSKVS